MRNAKLGNHLKQATQKAHIEQIEISPNTSGKTLSQVQVKREPRDKGWLPLSFPLGYVIVFEGAVSQGFCCFRSILS